MAFEIFMNNNFVDQVKFSRIVLTFSLFIFTFCFTYYKNIYLQFTIAMKINSDINICLFTQKIIRILEFNSSNEYVLVMIPRNKKKNQKQKAKWNMIFSVQFQDALILLVDLYRKKYIRQLRKYFTRRYCKILQYNKRRKVITVKSYAYNL